VPSSYAQLTAWIDDLRLNLRTIRTTRDARIWYAARDLPFFYYGLQSELGSFKLYFWLKTIQGDITLKTTPFSANWDEGRFLPGLKALLAEYMAVPSIEIWNRETVQSTVRQVLYCFEAGYIQEPETAELLLSQLKIVLEHVSRQAEFGRKKLAGDMDRGMDDTYRLYANDILLLDNSVLVTSPGLNVAFLTYNAQSYLRSTDSGMCSRMLAWYEHLAGRSTNVTKSSEKERLMFFADMSRSVDQAISRL
jgi:hypothetical protein